MEAAQRVQLLVSAYGAYLADVSEYYDEVVLNVIKRVEQVDCFSKLEIAALVSWKRLQANTSWMRRLMGTPDVVVQEVTGRAVGLARDETLEPSRSAATARSALSTLPGFGTGDALASTLCFVAAPDRLAVYDRRADCGLGVVGLELSSSPGRYGRYMDLVEGCRRELFGSGHAWSARQVDLALYQLGEPSSHATMPAQALSTDAIDDKP